MLCDKNLNTSYLNNNYAEKQSRNIYEIKNISFLLRHIFTEPGTA